MPMTASATMKRPASSIASVRQCSPGCLLRPADHGWTAQQNQAGWQQHAGNRPFRIQRYETNPPAQAGDNLRIARRHFAQGGEQDVGDKHDGEDLAASTAQGRIAFDNRWPRRKEKADAIA